MSGEFLSEVPTDAPERKREIRVLGFIELDIPKVMLSIDGRSQVFSAGETIDRITVTEIQQPRVKIHHDGVSWNASLFDSDRR